MTETLTIFWFSTELQMLSAMKFHTYLKGGVLFKETLFGDMLTSLYLLQKESRISKRMKMQMQKCNFHQIKWNQETISNYYLQTIFCNHSQLMIDVTHLHFWWSLQFVLYRGKAMCTCSEGCCACDSVFHSQFCNELTTTEADTIIGIKAVYKATVMLVSLWFVTITQMNTVAFRCWSERGAFAV